MFWEFSKLSLKEVCMSLILNEMWLIWNTWQESCICFLIYEFYAILILLFILYLDNLLKSVGIGFKVKNQVSSLDCI